MPEIQITFKMRKNEPVNKLRLVYVRKSYKLKTEKNYSLIRPTNTVAKRLSLKRANRKLYHKKNV